MASAFRMTFPDRLQSALESRSSVVASDCPADVSAAMSRLSFFSAAAAAAATAAAAPASSRFAGRLDNREAAGGAGTGSFGHDRFVHLSGSGGGGGGGGGSSGWRPTQHHSQSSGGLDDDGFQTYTRRRGGASGGGDRRYDGNRSGTSGGGGGGVGERRYDSQHRGGGKTGSWGGGGHGKYYGSRSGGGGGNSSHSATPASAPAGAAVAAGQAPMGSHGESSADAAPAIVAFSSAAVKANVATEERILAKVKGKINKIGPSTYDATKTFMQQILDSDETDFLDDFMKFVFEKAATESSFCPMYARLLHELADEFTHLRDVMRTLFRDYTSIFTEVEPTAPDPSSESYKEFVAGQERKKFRRGYSQFVAELVKHGEVDLDAFRTLLFQIVTVIEGFQADECKKQLSEEYIDCLSNMCKSVSLILIEHAWSGDILVRLTALVSKPPTSLPGFTHKARFALMNLKDFAARGWK